MNDYLWDKTGEPDREVQRLEEVLGTLGHRPERLDLPSTVLVQRSRMRTWLALAAAAVVLLFLSGAWLLVSRDGPSEGKIAVTPLSSDQPSTNDAAAAPEKTPVVPAMSEQTEIARKDNGERKGRRKRPSRMAIARSSQARASDGLLTVISQRQQAAKEQLVYALRLTSETLNDVQSALGPDEKGSSEGLPDQF